MRHIDRLFAGVALLFAMVTAIGQEANWTVRPPATAFPSLWTLHTVPDTDIYEVAPTKIYVAKFRDLEKKPFTEISCETAKYFTGPYFKCGVPTKRPFLIRAVYENGGTGQFVIRYRDRELFVHHGSLGQAPGVVNLPLIVNLPFEPTNVFTWTSGAM